MNWSTYGRQLGLIAALGIALVLVGVIARMGINRATVGQTELGSPPSEKLYSNQQFGFSFLYPSDGTVAVLGPGAVQMEINDRIPPFALVVETESLDMGRHSLQDVLFAPNPEDTSDTFYRSLVRQQSPGSFMASTTIGADEALALGVTCADGSRPLYLYYAVHDDILYQVSAADLCSYPNGVVIFHSLLSSFTFATSSSATSS